MKKIFYLVSSLLMTLPAVVFAEGSGGGGGEGDASGGDTAFTLPNPLSSENVTGIINRVIDFLLLVAGPIAVVMTIYSAYLFITAGDNQEKVKKARKTLMYVIIGVAILILSKGIVNFTKSFLEVPEPASSFFEEQSNRIS